MAREIKFRAWHKKLKKMLFVTDISGVVDLQKDSTEIYEISCAERNNGGWVNGGSHEIDDVELLQYTGLTDKNGKEIYEGDIVTALMDTPPMQHAPLGDSAYMKGAVIFEYGSFLVDGEYLWGEHLHSIEVIGNIHENPELI